MGMLLVVMCLGVALGATVFPDRLRGLNNKLTLLVTGLLIFSMGVSLGGRPAFLEELTTIGVSSLLFCLIPVISSVAVVYLLTRTLMADITKRHKEDARQREEEEGSSFRDEAVMMGVVVGALMLGVTYGLSGLGVTVLDVLSAHSNQVLLILMFLVGISVGSSKDLLSRISEYGLRVLIIPLGIILGSIAGGLICALVLGMDWAVGAAIASGLGWGSLSGPMMSGIAGAQIGSITFLASLLREIISFFSIPWISRHLNYPTCIAPAAATSEDTTLPMLIRCTNAETVVLAVVNGIICSLAVPLLIEFFHFFM